MMEPESEVEHIRRAQATKIHWNVLIPLRDGIELNTTLYLPTAFVGPSPCIVTLTPYGADTYHDTAMHFSAAGLPFAIVDVRGRGKSQGEFRPNIQEANDGHDVVEWIAGQSYCDGRVAMWGGSYGGYAQWATAKEFPRSLATIVPTAAPFLGVDVPIRNNIRTPETAQYLTLVSGRASQWNVYKDRFHWAAQWRDHFEKGHSYRDLVALLGGNTGTFLEYLEHPARDAFWDAYNPTPQQYGRMTIPILTITGIYDDDQPGALMHYRQHMNSAPREVRERHYLIIGPWDHAGTRTPQATAGGLQFGPASLVDINKVHLEWYRWTLGGGPRPAFLKSRVAYYLTGAEEWRYAGSLEAVTTRHDIYFLDSDSNPTDVSRAGALSRNAPFRNTPDYYVYDPRNVESAALESTVDPANLVDQRLVHADTTRKLIYHTAPLMTDIEVSGFFKLNAWIAIDQPDTDFGVSIHEVTSDGRSILLTTDRLRARYRENEREPRLIQTTGPLRYQFERFTFASRLIRKGSRIRLVIGPVNSIYCEKNFNGGGIVADESIADARTVRVTVFHDATHPSALLIPIGRTSGRFPIEKMENTISEEK